MGYIDILSLLALVNAGTDGLLVIAPADLIVSVWGCFKAVRNEQKNSLDKSFA